MKKNKILRIKNLSFFSKEISYTEEIYPEGFQPYIVKKGDTLAKIAPAEHWNLIKRINRIDERHLPLGRKILIPGPKLKDFKKAINFCPVPKMLPDFQNFERVLYFFLDAQYFGAYENNKLIFWGPISSGKPGFETPVGKFQALWRDKDYVSRKYGVAMPYAINFCPKGYFFHQQTLPGRPASKGCVRLLMTDAKRLFYWIKKGDPIIII